MIVTLGSTGMLGQAIVKYTNNNNIDVIGIARSNADINIDVTNTKDLIDIVNSKKPKVIINCIAISDLDYCEKNIEKAYLINAHLVSVLVNICVKLDIYLIHISTDHFFVNDLNKKHDELSNVCLVNNYARTKYAGECFALTYKKSLVIRTNIVGFRGAKDRPTFIEWVLSSLKNNDVISMFDDFYTSSIDVNSLVYYLFLLIKNKNVYGFYNIASRDVFNKVDFIKKLSSKFGYKLDNYRITSVKGLNTLRADSLGLDVSKVESKLGCYMPTIDQVVNSLYLDKGGICLK